MYACVCMIFAIIVFSAPSLNNWKGYSFMFMLNAICIVCVVLFGTVGALAMSTIHRTIDFGLIKSTSLLILGNPMNYSVNISTYIIAHHCVCRRTVQFWSVYASLTYDQQCTMLCCGFCIPFAKVISIILSFKNVHSFCFSNMTNNRSLKTK